MSPHSSGVERVTCNHKVVSSNLTVGFCCDVRAVKEIDLKSIGLCPRRFKSCSQRKLCCRTSLILVIIGGLAQMVERSLCMREVVGSMPTFSTKHLWCSGNMLPFQGSAPVSITGRCINIFYQYLLAYLRCLVLVF